MNEFLTLYGKPDCSLCDAAEALLRELGHSRGVRWQKVDITGDPELQERWGWRIPVVTSGELVLDEGRVTAARLQAALDGIQAKARRGN
jgi:glutaredoxin